MEASCGTAKYEQAFRSLVWRIEQLPVKNKGRFCFGKQFFASKGHVTKRCVANLKKMFRI